MAGFIDGTYNQAPTATFTPTATAYGGGDVIEGAKAFVGAGPSAGGAVLLVGTVLEVAHTALIASEAGYTLEIYSVTPPSALADNAVWDLPSGDRASHLASIALGTPVDKGSTLKVEQDFAASKMLAVPVGGSLFGYLVTAGAFTPTAAARKVTLRTVAA